MKISEVISQLAAIQSAHGDLPVFVPDCEDEHEADRVIFIEAEKPKYAQAILPAHVSIW